MNGPTLTVNLAALTRNYQQLQKELRQAECAAVVKANGYGLGAVPIAQSLAKAGCKTFFVATLEEALQLREEIGVQDPAIYVFHGVRAGEEKTFLHHRLRPVLNTPEQVALWANAGSASALQLDTGLSRLGLNETETSALAATPELFAQAGISLVMSHLACADEPEHPKNAEQLERFAALSASLPAARRSLANSAGIFLSDSFHFDMARTGCALYGISPAPKEKNPMEHVATLEAPILQIRTLERESAIGYDATCIKPEGTRIAIVELGYADGFFRHLSNKGIGFISGISAPILGRISMDMMAIDISHLPESEVNNATTVEFICKDYDVNALAASTGTIGYEIFTRLGARVKRVYT